jgi:hypothetical protein
MRSRRLAVIAVLFLLALTVAARAQTYHIVKQTLLGGEGGWDYVTVDANAHRIYVPRGTHVMVLDEQTHKTVADIPGMREFTASPSCRRRIAALSPATIQRASSMFSI